MGKTSFEIATNSVKVGTQVLTVFCLSLPYPACQKLVQDFGGVKKQKTIASGVDKRG